MAELSGMRVAVIGAGVFGLCTALRAVHAGANVEVFDPAPLGDNASGVAAGMIAPVGERLFDQEIALPFDLLRAGRDGWPALRTLSQGLHVDPCGAHLVFPDEPSLDAAFDLLRSVGAEVSIDKTDPRAFRLWTPEDWRVEPQAAIAAIGAAVVAHGGTITPSRLGVDKFADFDAVVLAAGIGGGAFAEAAPELSMLAPIKGQMVRIAAPREYPAPGPILRAPDVYLVPQSHAILAGATMENGRSDRTVDAEAIMALRRRALDLIPALDSLPFQGVVGVRASTPDGLPLAGPSSRPGLFLATGARRNGWLLAPLVSQILVSYLSDGDGGPYAAHLDPRRFARA